MTTLTQLGAVLLGPILFAGCAGSASAASTADAPTAAKQLLLAVVGDSISKTVILPPSPIPCKQEIGPPPACQYSHDTAQAYPALVGAQLGARVTNLALPGAQSTVATPTTDTVTYPTGAVPALLTTVGTIPADADVVIYEAGTNDIVRSGNLPETYTRPATVAAAIHAQAPRAKIVYVGARYFAFGYPPYVDAWNAREQALAAADGGAFVDLRGMNPDDLADWPDGTHPSPAGVQKVADLVVAGVRAVLR